MLEGLYSGAAGMLAQQQRLDALANDIANVSTPGYRSLRVGFRDLLYRQDGPAALPGVEVGSGVAAVTTGRSAQPSALRETGEPLDLAIQGRGYLQVRRRDGSLALTRDGSFRVDARGELVTAAGDRLVPPLRLPAGTQPGSVRIAPDGLVTVGERRIGRIELVDVAAPEQLLPVGDNLFLPTRGSGPTTRVRDASLVQGALEQSNVDLGEAMVGLIEAQRAYQLASRVIQTHDQLLEIANGVRK
ncbi:flagellar hook-basal body protein [Thermoleophilum album]|uniref:Flagellar basal-body rod protein FlgG n=1 Tax=Thermoleophilum album TaxID=29539 RepID=A0A1H6FVB0_THEAL|nr:flagellar hook-basal body protein [Thermoleophilum album]SEH14736.1 flagellar basal-body rod protein FlgG [Thermoleophilum album]